jgi:hypothetical protein
LSICLPVFATESPDFTCEEKLGFCQERNKHLMDEVDVAVRRAEWAEKATVGIIEVAGCALAGAGVGYVLGNTKVGLAAAGVGCFLMLPF